MATAASAPGNNVQRIAMRTLITATNAVAHSGPSIAPTVSIVRSNPNARPTNSGATASVSNTSRAGPRIPRPIQPIAREASTCGHAPDKSKCKSGKAGQQISGNRYRLTQMRTIGNPSAGKFCETRNSVGDAFDDSQRICGRAKSGQQNRQQRSANFMSPVGTQTRQSNSENAARQPALICLRFLGGCFHRQTRTEILN